MVRVSRLITRPRISSRTMLKKGLVERVVAMLARPTTKTSPTDTAIQWRLAEGDQRDAEQTEHSELNLPAPPSLGQRRHDQCSDQGTGSRAALQQAQTGGVGMQNSRDHRWKHWLIRLAEERWDRGDHEQGEDRRILPDVAAALPGRCVPGLGLPWTERRHLHQEERGDDREEARPVDEEAPGGSDRGEGDAGEGGTEDSAALELRGVQGDGVLEILTRVPRSATID